MHARKMMPFVMAMALVGLLGPQLAYADYAYSDVQVGVATVKTFTVTANAQGATNSDPTHPGTATAVLWANSTTGTDYYVNMTVIGSDDQVGPYPECTTPILVFKNTGTTAIDLSITLNNTVTGTTWMYNSSLTSGSATGTPQADIVAFSTAASSFVTGLGLNNQTNLCIWTNFTAVSGGSYGTAFNYTSS